VKDTNVKTDPEVLANEVAMNLNGKSQLPAFAADVNLLGDNIDTMKNTQKECRLL
jgi:hypothetical protein